MSLALLVDVLIVILVIFGVLLGWTLGGFAAVASTAGIVGGLVAGTKLAPWVGGLAESGMATMLLSLLTLVVAVCVGYSLGAALGSAARRLLSSKPARRVEQGVGAVFQGIATMLVVWLISLPLAASVAGPLGSALQNSKVLAFVDDAMPPAAERLPAAIASLFNESGLPPMISPFTAMPPADIEPPSGEIEDPALIERARPSVIHVQGSAYSCSKRLMGSGFVTAPDYVVTNAHVVAGTDTVSLDTVDGTKEAQVVYYNPEFDIAVLHSPGLGLPALPWAEYQAEPGQNATVLGFPLSGPFRPDPVRVSAQQIIAGPDIYAGGRVERETYVVRGTVQQGNSGGPMIDAEGHVLGVVFGTAVDDSDTGFTLTADEVRRQIGDVHQYTEPVDTQECVAS
ncbi:MarP family serine protease [Corynebacterium otitidis]|uniref:Putative secreted protein n=1 Tax=Corynebacterium otitidis ATCC 51513 TaxID=883169 RepID=I7IXE6_9CORY|nr:MarP family serine protease [Corynebacterium otitidis]EJZ81809.1 hypothetical protein HMPREF9719_01264 [Corynebacterium otitidis ATCC 51513]KKO83185.1 membrane protein [Corynebacterium otitidis]CCI83758.1 putative secreted protein [Corynebacterium otitidis ATCC 51513]